MIPLGYLTGSQMGWHIISNNIVTGPLRQIKTKKPFVCAVVEVNVALLFLLRRQSEVAGRSTRPSHYATLLQVQLLGICPRVVLFDALLVTNLYNLVKSDLRLMAPSLYIVYIYIYKSDLQATCDGRQNHQDCSICLFTEACPRLSTAPPKL